VLYLWTLNLGILNSIFAQNPTIHVGDDSVIESYPFLKKRGRRDWSWR